MPNIIFKVCASLEQANACVFLIKDITCFDSKENGSLPFIILFMKKYVLS